MSAAKNLDNQHDEESEAQDELSLDGDFGSGAGGHDDGEGIWLLSYSDLMTLLMGFFALMTSMASFEEEKFKEVGGEAAEYFGGKSDKTYEELGEVINEIIEKRGLSEQVQIETKKTQIKITFQGTLFFDSGSIDLKENAKPLMNEIVQILGEHVPKHKILVEGHTDDIPIEKNIIASNWELASLRAAVVARLFERIGFSRQQIMVIGWGETRPLVPNRNEKSEPIPVNQAKNRRVVLKIMDSHPL
jgi:chemotaxis protein MotB